MSITEQDRMNRSGEVQAFDSLFLRFRDTASLSATTIALAVAR
jgi:hypothetical protein